MNRREQNGRLAFPARLLLPRRLCALAILLVALSNAIADEPKSADQAGVYQDNVVIVLDASGSMSKPMPRANLSRMQAAKLALLKVTETLPPSTNVGLLVFSSSNLPNDWVYPLSPVNQHALRAAIQMPEPGGVTPLGAYLKKGADALLAQRQKQRGYGTYRLLAVTDGEATDAPLMLSYFPEILARGITVDVIGVDMDGEHTLARRANSYRRADNPESLVRAVSEVFAEVGSGDKQDTVDADQFALLQQIPTELAGAMLSALTETGNEPIGEQVNSSAAGSAGQPPVGAIPPQPGAGEQRGIPTWAIVLFAILFIVIRAAFRGQKPQPRRKR